MWRRASVWILVLFGVVLGCKPGEPAKGNPGSKLTELKTDQWGALEGFVGYEGEPPPPIDRRKEIGSTMEQHCLKGPEEELLDPTWKVNKKNKGVANVVVYLQPPPGRFFVLEENDKKREEVVTLEMPFCAFRPHALVLFPRYYDGREWKETGQHFKFRNNSMAAQGISYYGRPGVNPSGAETLHSQTERFLAFKPQVDPVRFSVAWNRWMHAYVWVLPHPYAAVSDNDGRFRIPRVPAGAEVRLFAWHEARGNFYGDKHGVIRTFKEGVNDLALSVSK